MTARLIFATGSIAGKTFELESAEVTLGRDRDSTVRFDPHEVIVSGHHARIIPVQDRHVLRDENSRNGTYVNGKRISVHELTEGDRIEFGPNGPVAVFAVAEAFEMHPTLELGVRTTLSGLYQEAKVRAGGDPSTTTGSGAVMREFAQLVYQRSARGTRRAVAITVTVGLVVVAGLLLVSQRRSSALQAALNELALNLETERTTRSQLSKNLADIQVLSDSLRGAVEQSRREIEGDIRFGRNVTRTYSNGVALLVFSYAYVDPNNGETLRYAVDRNGNLIVGAGRPSIRFGGDGPVIEQQGTATAFLVDSAGWLVTNRHVAEPWAEDPQLQSMKARGLEVEGRFQVLRAYFPPGDQSHDLTVSNVSEAADVALLKTRGGRVRAPVLPLAPADSAPQPGGQVVFIGFPTGIHNLLFRVSQADREEILSGVGDDAVKLAEELARRHVIQPLVSNGSISDTTTTEVIHTAETTVGGSGGPLIGSRRQVIAVHYAAVVAPGTGDPFRTHRGVRVRYAWQLLPAELRESLSGTPPR